MKLQRKIVIFFDLSINKCPHSALQDVAAELLNDRTDMAKLSASSPAGR
jgi:hypothetical protein